MGQMTKAFIIFFHYGRAGWHQRSDVNDFDQLNFTLE